MSELVFAFAGPAPAETKQKWRAQNRGSAKSRSAASCELSLCTITAQIATKSADICLATRADGSVRSSEYRARSSIVSRSTRPPFSVHRSGPIAFPSARTACSVWWPANRSTYNAHDFAGSSMQKQPPKKVRVRSCSVSLISLVHFFVVAQLCRVLVSTWIAPQIRSFTLRISGLGAFRPVVIEI